MINQDDPAYAFNNPVPAPDQGGTPLWLRVALVLGYTLFVLGGLYFGYLFFITIRDVTAYTNLPAPVVAPPQSVAAPTAQGPAAQPPAQAPAPIAPPIPTPSVAQSPVWDRKGRVNMLLMGTDEGRQCDDGIPRTDTLILLSLDLESKRAAMISIPRDLWVEIPGRGIQGIPREERINTAYTWGEVYRYPGGGVKLARDTVERNFGIPIHFHAVINITGLKNVVDKLGGVEIEVTKRLYDDNFPTPDCGTTVIDFKPGTYTMNGNQALAYARSRYTTSDFDRAERQQQVLMAIRKKALQLDIIPKVPALWLEYRNIVKTDLSALEILALANAAKDIDTANIHRYAIGPDQVVYWVQPNGAQVLIPDRAKIRALFEKAFSSQPTAGGTGN